MHFFNLLEKNVYKTVLALQLQGIPQTKHCKSFEGFFDMGNKVSRLRVRMLSFKLQSKFLSEKGLLDLCAQRHGRGTKDVLFLLYLHDAF